MTVLKLILFTLFITGSHCRYPDKVYCVDEECKEPISKAKTLLTYNSADPDLLSFRGNKDAIVYMKSAGTNSDLWFVSINGKSGFANNKFLRENKIIEKNPLVIVPYEPKVPENLVQPDKVQQAHEVFEGTTIYTTEAASSDTQQDSTTESQVVSINNDNTPPLDSSDNQIQSENVESIPPQDHSEAKQDSHAKENIDQDINTTTEIPKQTEAVNVIQENNVDSTVETVAESTEEIVAEIINDENKQPVDPEVPKDLLVETSSQQIMPSSNLNSQSLLEVPDNKEFNSLTEPQQSEIKEQNTSTPNNNVDNMPAGQNPEPSLPNGDVSSQNIPPTDQTQSSLPPVIADTAQQGVEQVTSEVSNINGIQANENVQPELSSLNHDGSEQFEPIPAVSDTTFSQSEIPPILETIPSIPPPVDTILPQFQVTTETIPALYPETTTTPTSETTTPTQETTTPTPETITSASETTPQPINVEQPIPDVASIEILTTTPSPDYTSEETTEPPYQSTPESTHKDNTEDISVEQLQEELSTTTETKTNDENTGGFFSNMFSTVADMLPPSTEAPPPIYNTEDYPTHESEKPESEGFSFIKYFVSLYYTVMGTSEESKALFAAVGETCYTDEYCDGTSNDGSNRLLTFLLTTASSVLLFTLGYYYIDNRRQDGRLIGQINSLQRDLLFTTKECEILKEELSSTKNKLAGIEDSSFGMDDMVQSLKEEISELKVTNDRLRNSLDDNEKLLRVSENTAGELQNTLSEVENTLSELLAERANSEEQIVELNGKIQAFEEELISVSRDRDNFQLKYVSAESALEEFKKQKKLLEDVNQQLTEAKNTIELQKHEINALKDAIKELKSGIPSNVDVSSLIDHTEIKAKLSKALEEKKALETKFEAEHQEKNRLTEELKSTQETLHTTSQNANEALTRLDVLGKYFQERESELMKELSAKESLWLSKQGESASTVEKIELLQQEVQRHKEKCDALTLELAEQESSRRTALSEVEARAHAAWLEARAARRDADAARDEAAALRRKLAALSTISAADGAVSPHHKVASPLDSVDNTVIPPPLPPMFLPPPLLPPLPRPPPLGRLPSPHPPRYGERRYTPDSRYSPESRYSPDSRYSPGTVRYSPDSRYSPLPRRSPYSPRSRRRSRSRERYEESRGSRSRNGPADTETEYNSDSPSREPRRRSRYSRHSGPSSGSGCSSESDK